MAFNTENFQLSLQNPLETARFAVEKITDTFLGQDNKIYYKVKWQETWEPEERLMSLCAQLVNEFWKEYYSRTQQQQQHQQQQQREHQLQQQQSAIHPAPQVGLPSQEHSQSQLQPTQVHQPPHSIQQGQHLNQLLAVPSSSGSNLLPQHSTVAQNVSLPHVPIPEQNQTQEVPTNIQQLQGVADFRVQSNSLEKRSTHVFLQPRFLSNSMLAPRFPFMPNFVHSVPPPSKACNTQDQLQGSAIVQENVEKVKKYTCISCEKVFTTKQNLKKHELLHHQAATSLCCQTCGKKFEKKTALTRHMLTHTTNRPHICSECGKGFKERSNLTKHLIIHTGARPHACDVCNARFRQLGHLLKHLLVHKSEKPHKCKICLKGFKRKEHLKDHLIIHTGDYPYQCEVCGKKFRFKTNLKVHILQHNGRKDFVCDVCQKAFTGKANLVQHRLIHDPDYSFNCNVCSKKFRRKGHLKRHMDIHKNERLLTCVFCKETFPNRPTYRKHLLVHTGSKPFVCTTCDKRFAAKSYLTQHMLTHTEELSFSCDKCDKKFGSESALAKHALIHSITKQFSCEKCNRTFRYNSNFKKHELNCNGVKSKDVKKAKSESLGEDEVTSQNTIADLSEQKSYQSKNEQLKAAVNNSTEENDFNNHYQNIISEFHSQSQLPSNIMDASTAVSEVVNKECVLHVVPNENLAKQMDKNQNVKSNDKVSTAVHFESLVLPESIVKQGTFSEQS